MSKKSGSAIEQGKYLVIVESPTKARTISRFLGNNFEVLSSKGHIVDLPKRRLGIDVDGDFSLEYQVIKGKNALIKEIRKLAQKKERIYLATDPDREGEAISQHLREQLPKIPDERFFRVVFHEITLDAIDEAFQHPQKVDLHKVDAQKARRVLDRIVGYFLSPLLWKKIARGLSAGRVQSVALRFIVEREREIEKFISVKTWTIEATFSKKDGSALVEAALERYQDKKIVFEQEQEADRVCALLKEKPFMVDDITDRQSRRLPSPPYITSTLQQDAFNKFRFPSSKTMMVAQKLYEGVELPEGMLGLITYMRTDSVTVAEKALAAVRIYIKMTWGEQYIPHAPNVYKNKKSSQGAHEAIRPTDITKTPESVQPYLNEDEFRLYNLIYKRFVASQMPPAVYKKTKVHIKAEEYVFAAEADALLFDGFLKLYPESITVSRPLGDFTKGEEVALRSLEKCEHVTKPPARFSDASLIKLLEEKGIGRPSTYAPTLGTLLARDYVRRQRGYLFPTPLGIMVIDMLMKAFTSIIDEQFTADMEERLDRVEEGDTQWAQIIRDFLPNFKAQVEKADVELKKEEMFVGEDCPQCHKPLIIKWSRKGRFISCSAFPECKFAKPFSTNVKCPTCGNDLVERRNKKGQLFYGCSTYPACTFTSRRLPEEKKGDQPDEDKKDESTADQAGTPEAPEAGQ